MDSRASRYRDRALDCEEVAVVAETDSFRRELLEFARQWRELAKQVEFLDDGIALH
jgi:hypothetical protein